MSKEEDQGRDSGRCHRLPDLSDVLLAAFPLHATQKEHCSARPPFFFTTFSFFPESVNTHLSRSIGAEKEKHLNQPQSRTLTTLSQGLHPPPRAGPFQRPPPGSGVSERSATNPVD